MYSFFSLIYIYNNKTQQWELISVATKFSNFGFKQIIHSFKIQRHRGGNSKKNKKFSIFNLFKEKLSMDNKFAGYQSSDQINLQFKI